MYPAIPDVNAYSTCRMAHHRVCFPFFSDYPEREKGGLLVIIGPCPGSNQCCQQKSLLISQIITVACPAPEMPKDRLTARAQLNIAFYNHPQMTCAMCQEASCLPLLISFSHWNPHRSSIVVMRETC